MALFETVAIYIIITVIVIAILAFIPSTHPTTFQRISLLERIILGIGGAIRSLWFVGLGIGEGTVKVGIRQIAYFSIVMFLVITVFAFFYGATELSETEDIELSARWAMRALNVGYDFLLDLIIPGR